MDFIGYTNITGDTTGENIGKAILGRLREIDLNLSDLRAQAYDGTGMYDTYNTKFYNSYFKLDIYKFS